MSEIERWSGVGWRGGSGELGEFLRAHRSRLRPEDVGLGLVGARRRVPGLRREELAQLAGVSASYYTRLEQGESRGASASVLEALAGALRLGPDEREHLHRLGATLPRRTLAARHTVERVGTATAEMLSVLDGVPAVVLGQSTDVLAWNPLGHALLAGHLDPTGPDRPADRPNMSRLVFLDAHTRDLWADWPRKARNTVGSLRLAVGRYPDDARLASLIGELSMTSPEFPAMWADHRIARCDAAAYTLRHPTLGELTLTQQSFDVARSPEQCLIAFTAAPGSPTAHALAIGRGGTEPVADRGGRRPATS